MTTVNIMTRIFGRTVMTLALMLLTATTAWAEDEQDGVWYYKVNQNNSECVITRCSATKDQVITIPKTLLNHTTSAVYTVTGIYDNAFDNCTQLEGLQFYEDTQIKTMPNVQRSKFNYVNVIKSDGSISVAKALPASITDIGNAFRGSGIEDLTMPGVTTMGDYAFEGCRKLWSLTFGQAASIGLYAFSNIIYYDANNQMFYSTTINYPGPLSNWQWRNYQYSSRLRVQCNDGACGWCGDKWAEGMELYKNASCLHWVLDNNGHLTIDCIDTDDFYENYRAKQIIKTAEWYNLTVRSLTLKHVYGSGNNSFYLLHNLTSVALNDDLVSIGEYAFYDCENLPSIVLPSSVTKIDFLAFANCSSLQDLYFKGTKAQWDAVFKEDQWNDNVSDTYQEHWRCTVTFNANGHGTAPADQILWSNETKVTEPAAPTADGWRFMGWYTDAACTTPWHFDTDIVPGDMTLYAKWAEPCAVTASADATSIDIPYGQEWTDIAVTLNSLTLGWFQNGTNPARVADAVAVTPLVGSGAGTSLTFTDSNAATLIARKGAGAHTNTSALSESLTAAGQSATLWVHIPEEVWKSAAAGDYSTFLNYDAVFISNDPTPAENYTYSLGSGARVLLSLTIPEAVTLSFDANGGTGTMDAVSGRKGFDMQLPACTFTAPDGKDFLCWNTKADGTGTRYYVGMPYSFSESQTFYAEWGEGYVLDLTATAVGESVVIPLGLSAQLTQLTGYFNNESDPMGLDLNLDGAKDLALVQEFDDVSLEITASVTKLTSLTENYRFLLTAPSEEGEYGSVLIKFASDGKTVEPPVIELLFDDNGTYNSGQLLVLKDGQPHNLMLSGRTMHTNGEWSTLCLPFDIDNFSGTPLEGFTVKELDTETANDGHVTGIEGSTLYLNFKDATRIEAGKPYIVKKSGSADIVNPVFYGVTVTTATKEIDNPFRETYEDPEFITVAVPTDVAFTSGKFCGNYDPVRISGEDKSILFLGAEKNLHFANDETLGALRAFVQIDKAAKPTSYVMNFGNGETSSGNLYIPGDANGDGQVTITDAVAIVNYILGNASADFNPEAANVNGDTDDDGKPNITITDAVAVVNIILNSSGSSAPQLDMKEPEPTVEPE